MPYVKASKVNAHCSLAGWPEIQLYADAPNPWTELTQVGFDLIRAGVNVSDVQAMELATPLAGLEQVLIIASGSSGKVPIIVHPSGWDASRTSAAIDLILALRARREFRRSPVCIYSSAEIPLPVRHYCQMTQLPLFDALAALDAMRVYAEWGRTASNDARGGSAPPADTAEGRASGYAAYAKALVGPALEVYMMDLDLSPSSLATLDSLLNWFVMKGSPQILSFTLHSAACYLGEVVRRTVGGEWITDPRGDPRAVEPALKLPDGRLVTPAEQLRDRLRNHVPLAEWFAKTIVAGG
jgi:hypothetical protein